ncbi:MAG TPA: DinB family protein [Holophagaceae bacterium]|nr:DinB family protein [Holophagaceae bacterium]
MIAALRPILRRDLDTLIRELELYPDDAGLWMAVLGQPTAGGNLALHLAGNLRHFIGATLGGTGYVREREREFSSTGLTREAVIAEVRLAAADVDATLAALEPARVAEPYPLEIQGIRLGTEVVLLHLATHLAFHLGQVDYHRRSVTGDRTSAGPLALAPLASR